MFVTVGLRILIISLRSARAPFLAGVLALLGHTSYSPTARANPLAPIWTGAYVGFHAGATWADVDLNSLGSFDTTTATGGGHIGYNIALGNIVVGIEGDASYDGADVGFSTAGGGSGNFRTDWSGTLRGRLGYSIGPALLYATAGYAWTETTLTERSATGTKSSASGSFDGIVYGVGAEAFVLPNLSLRLEALRFDYAAETLSLPGAAAAAREVDPSDTVVRAGVTFHFN